MSFNKIIDFNDLPSIRRRHPHAKIVHCHGVFDVLHAGHLAYFESAKKFGDFLVVTITADQFVNKGPGRPYFNSTIRSRMLAALELVNAVAVNKSPTAVPAIETLRPHFYVKGPDYADKSRDVTGAILQEEAAAEKGGGKLVFTSEDTFSSSELLNRFFVPWTDEQTKTINEVKTAGGLDAIGAALDLVAKESACVIGEPIIDTYSFCVPEAISSKSPSISARHLYEENYAGGSLAIANHLAGFVKDVSIIFTHGNEPFFLDLLKDKMAPEVEIHGLHLPNIPTPRKTRFIADGNKQRLFELTDIRSDQWYQHSPSEFTKLAQKYAGGRDTVKVVADFGHGLFEGPAADLLQSLDGFIGLNVQTNSSNFGFNRFNKHKHFNYLSIDTKEARLAYHDRFSPPLDVVRKIRADFSDRSIAMTIGSNGSYLFPGGSKGEYMAPAFADNVVDATGAGDAFFAMTSMLVKVGCSEIITLFLGNVFAGLKTRIIGNKSAVSKAQLVKAATAILK